MLDVVVNLFVVVGLGGLFEIESISQWSLFSSVILLLHSPVRWTLVSLFIGHILIPSGIPAARRLAVGMDNLILVLLDLVPHRLVISDLLLSHNSISTGETVRVLINDLLMVDDDWLLVSVMVLVHIVDLVLLFLSVMVMDLVDLDFILLDALIGLVSPCSVIELSGFNNLVPCLSLCLSHNIKVDVVNLLPVSDFCLFG